MPDPLKILIVSRNLDVSGPTTYTLSLAQGLIRANHRVAVVTAGGLKTDDLRAMQVPVWERPSLDSAWRSRLMPIRAFKEILDFKPDLIHVQSRDAVPMGRNLARYLDAPVIATIHRDYSGRPRLVGHETGAVIAVSDALRENLVNHAGVPKELIHVVPNGVDVDRYSAEPPMDSPGREPVVGGMGRLEKRRGFDILLRAAARVAASGRRARYIILGDGPEREFLAALASELKIREAVIMPGEVADPRPALADMDVFVNPAFSEAFGLPVLEAMATGRPVIATSVGGAPSMVIDGESGFLIAVGDVDALADRLLKLLADRALRLSMGHRGEEIAREKFGIDNIVAQTIEIYRHLVREHSESRAIEKALAAGRANISDRFFFPGGRRRNPK
jgi:glycosyltransferase involved in cell wall biosynthesis